jgi:hypothetical protein
MTELVSALASGTSGTSLCGKHPYTEVLDNAVTFRLASNLSQNAARTIANIKTTDAATTFTQYAVM